MTHRTHNDNFSRSLRCALVGVAYALRTQANMRFHFLAAAVVLLAALALGVTAGEFALLFFAVFLVLTAEMFNTAVEKVVDLITSEYHPLARAAKDAAAGAVLLAALNSVIIGLLVFLPRLAGILVNRK
ncbi:diacylglycerol kinase [Desulfotomaculum copahuensis]|uniref:Diacylglycerol kinase n=1 Tax=Desulfotomaculum copahuensis TaxID=1838280 RepID=A0A1B7LHQ1_9FIRM|nr:diacylglycerol kinase family protein [Desulfotomaculum copahuensis]OAT85788.1 diacylglycerol kinase [Desulfotomaculum copahuensis]